MFNVNDDHDLDLKSILPGPSTINEMHTEYPILHDYGYDINEFPRMSELVICGYDLSHLQSIASR